MCPQCSVFVHPGHWEPDTTDPTLTTPDVTWVGEVAWFHSSTHKQWPPQAVPKDRAIHLGTYEAAIDNMHYRMSAMSEAGRQFYLHRVVLPTISIDPEMHRDEGQAFTGIVDLTAVTSTAYDGYRYVNLEEHTGSISLAVNPRAINSVQTIAIPDLRSHVSTVAAASLAATAYDDECAAAEATLTDRDRQSPPARLEWLLGTTDSAQRLRDRDHRIWSARTALFDRLAIHYLAGVAPRHRDLLEQAIRSLLSHDFAAAQAHDLYRSYSAAITYSDHVLRVIDAAQKVRL